MNSVNPTVTMTAMGREVWGGAKGEAMLKKIPLRRFAEMDDVANAVVFLLSDKAAMTTGTVMPIDGGYTCA